MQDPLLPARDVVLIGAGHTNLHIVRQWRMRPIAGVKLTLISPFSRATYSGMLPGTLAGIYQADDMQVDLYRFTAGTGIRLIVAEATGLQPADRLITFADRAPIRFDVASIGIGSVPSRSESWQQSPRILSIKPMATFLQRLQAAVDHYARPDAPFHCVIAGAGAAGTEVAFCIDQWFRKRATHRDNESAAIVKGPQVGNGGQGSSEGLSPQTARRSIKHTITILDSNPEILPGYVPALVKRARRLLAERGIQVQVGQRAVGLDEGQGRASLRLDGGTSLPADIVIWATNASPPAVLAGFELPKAADGFLAVRSTLQTTAEAPVFVVGDTASFVDQRVPKAGVYAVREGPILWDNLHRMLAGHPLTEYHPQRGFLSLLSTGDGRALLQYRGWTHYGRWAWRLKDYIDRNFMRMHQDYAPPMRREDRLPFTPPVPQPTPQMHCGGCGCKVGPDLLSSVLKRLRAAFPETTAALQHVEDAHVIEPSSPSPQVLSVDFFRAFLDDPFLTGRIAVLHALSDLWAMGARPTGVQAIITLPYGPPQAQAELLFQLLAGAAIELRECDAELWGGHTIEGPELQIGFSVAGDLAQQLPWRKSGLQVGDALILTKRLGTGTLLAAHDQALCRTEWFDELLSEMLLSNGPAQIVGHRFPIHAATDITGFGIGGHLLEMLEGSNCSASLTATALSQVILPGFRELAARGMKSTLAPALLTSLGRKVRDNSAAGDLLPALIDPQTSGGLLFAIASQHANELLAGLINEGYRHATQVGTVVPASQHGIAIEIR